MKKIFKQTAVYTAFVLSIFQSCIKDSGKLTYSFYTPVLFTTAAVRASIKGNVAQPIVNPGKICIKDNYIFLAEKEKGIHIIDNSDPSNPINKAFISIPGNEDLAINNQILYADCYTDLLAIDISNITNIYVKSYTANIYPSRRYVNGYTIDSGKVAIDWIKRDTTVSASISVPRYWYLSSNAYSLLSPASSSAVGTNGSTTKMTIINDRLYTISSEDLIAINISSPNTPSFLNKTNLHLGIGAPETIYPFKNNLFLGSTAGLYIFSIANPDNPSLLKTFTHATACDPVITDGNYAYVTLKSGTLCNGITNELQIINVSDLLNPSIIKSYSMSGPSGLGKDGNILIICDDVIKFYDASNASNLLLLKTMPAGKPYDVICTNGNAIVTATDGLYQFNYSNTGDIKQTSLLTISKQ